MIKHLLSISVIVAIAPSLHGGNICSSRKKQNSSFHPQLKQTPVKQCCTSLVTLIKAKKKRARLTQLHAARKKAEQIGFKNPFYKEG